MTNHTHVKVPCGGWILERVSAAHIKRCEMCEAMLDYRQQEFNHKANIIGVVVVCVIGCVVAWLIYRTTLLALLLQEVP